MPDASISSTESTFGTISGTFTADQSTISGTVYAVTGTVDGSVGVPGPQGPTGPQGPEGPPGPPGTGGTWGSIVGTLSNQTDLQNALDAKQSVSGMSAYLTKAGNLTGLTDLAAARDNLQLGALYTPTFAGVTAQGSGSNVANLTPTSLTLNQTGYGYFTIQPSQGIRFPDASVQTSAFTPSLLLPYAPLASPLFTGDPRGPTAALGDNDTSLATTAFVQQELASGTAVAKNLEVYVRNQTGSTLAAGAIVYINGATGNRPTVTLAQANNDANSAQTFGFVKTAIANNGFGYVIVRGELENIDTSALTEGVQLYLSPTTPGAWTTTKPSAPQHLVYVGIVVRAHPTQGVILVAVQNGYELNELHDVQISSPTNGQVLKYNASTGLWYNGTDVGGVAWGGITGTLSAQTDLQTALDAKLDSSTAASTYYPLSNPDGYINATTADTLYYSISNPSGFITAYQGDFSYLKQSYNLSDLDDVSAARTNLGLGTMATATASDYSTTTVANGLYYPLSSNPAGYLTSASLSGYAQLSGATFTGEVVTPASTTSSAGLTITPGVAPTTPTNGEIWATTNDIQVRLNGVTETLAEQSWVTSQLGSYALRSGTTFTGLVTTAASTATTAGLNLPHGTAPTTPVNGDVWTTTSGLLARINGVTRQYVDLDGTQTINGAKTFSGANQTLGNSTTAGTINIGTGAVASGSKAINIGTGTVAPGTCTMVFGTAGVAGNITFNGNGTFTVNNNNVQIHGNTATSTVNIGVGATVAAAIKTINIGTEGLASSTTNINLGTVAGGAATVTTNALLLTRASATTGAGLRVPHGTAPTSPTNGDIWTDTAGVYARINGATVTLTPPTAATVAEAKAGTDTAKFINANVLQKVVNSPSYYKFPRGLLTGSTSGTGASVASGALITNVIGTTTGAGWAQYKYYGISGIDIVNATGWRVGGQSIDFSKKFRLTGSTNMLGALPTNTIVRVMFGKNANDGGGDPTQRCIGWRYNQATGFIEIIAHNGTTLSTLTTASNPAASSWFEWELYNDGAGNVQMFVNDTSIGTVTGGPVSPDFGSAPTYVEEVQCTATPSAQPQVRFRNGGLFLQP